MKKLWVSFLLIFLFFATPLLADYYDKPWTGAAVRSQTIHDTKAMNGDDTDLFYYAARYYDPGLGRFITPDPITPGLDSQSLNPYSYCENNPVSLTDPTGNYPNNQFGNRRPDSDWNRGGGMARGMNDAWHDVGAAYLVKSFPTRIVGPGFGERIHDRLEIAARTNNEKATLDSIVDELYNSDIQLYFGGIVINPDSSTNWIVRCTIYVYDDLNIKNRTTCDSKGRWSTTIKGNRYGNFLIQTSYHNGKDSVISPKYNVLMPNLFSSNPEDDDFSKSDIILFTKRDFGLVDDTVTALYHDDSNKTRALIYALKGKDISIYPPDRPPTRNFLSKIQDWKLTIMEYILKK